MLSRDRVRELVEDAVEAEIFTVDDIEMMGEVLGEVSEEMRSEMASENE